MATLTGTRVKDTYKDLLQVSNSNSGIDSTLRTVSDGEATDSILELSSAAVNITGAGTLQYGGTAITSTAAELNVLDGISATVTELNYTDGVTSNIQTQLDATLDTAGSLIDLSSTTINVDLTEAGEAAIANGDYILFLDGGATGTHAKEALADVATLFAGNGLTATDSVIESDVHALTEAILTSGDYIAFSDEDQSGDPTRRESIDDIATLFAGTGLTASSAVIGIDAAQTVITSLLATDIKIGEDDQTKIDFETADTINFYAGNEKQLILTDGALTPGADNILDLGSSGVEFKNAYFDGTVTSDAFAGPLTGDVTGNVSGTAATVTTAAQTSITSLGTLTALTVDDVAINGKVITMTGSSSDTAVFTAGTNGTLSVVTTDAAAAAANIQITADGTVDIDSAGVLTLDSGAAINLEPASGSAILLDGTISVDAGVVTGATSVTSTAFVGDITGDVTGNADTATLATTVTVTDSTANTNFPVVFHNESNALLDDTGALRYNPSTGELLVPKLTVAGTTTTADTVTMEAANAVIFEGATADSYETTLSIVDPTADHTQYLINQTGYIPLLAASTSTAISSTPAELNVLDGYTGSVTELNYLDTLHATGVTNTEFDYLDGVTSNIQTQLDATLDTAGTGIDISSTTVSVDVSDFMANGANNYIVTATGTDAMNAEANLTFDGTSLGVGTTSPEGKVHIYQSDASVAPDSDGDDLVIESNADTGISILAGESNGETGSLIFGSDNDAYGAGLAYHYYDKTLSLKTAHSSGILRLASANNTTAMTIDSSQDVTINAGSLTLPVAEKLFFGGGAHTYIGEDVDDRLRFFTGGAEFMRFTEDTSNTLTFYQPMNFQAQTVANVGDVKINATNKLYLDGGDDTFISQTSANTVSFYAGGTSNARWSYDNNSVDIAVDTTLAATKKLYLDGGGNTYIYEESADNVMFYIGGRNMLRLHEGNGEVVVNDSQVDTNFRVESDTIDDLFFCDAGTSRVGIGTNGPFAKLHISNGTAGVSALDFEDASDCAIFIDAVQTADYFQPLIGVGEDATTLTAAISSYDDGGSAAQGLVFHTGNTTRITEVMRITASGSGYVGIGNPAPAHRLSVSDNGGGTDDFFIVNPGNGHNRTMEIAGDAINVTTTGGGSNTLLLNEDGGDVDICNGKVYVDESASALIVGATAQIATVGGTGSFQVLGTGGGDSLLTIGRFSDNAGAPQINFAKSRNGTIGSNTVVQDDDSCGEINWCVSDGSDMISYIAQLEAEVDGTPGSNDTPGRLMFKTTADGAAGPTEHFRIASNGDLTATDTSIASNSDLRLKKNIENFEGGLDIISKLQPRNFEWRNPEIHKEGTRRGFIAQEVKEVDEYWINTKKIKEEEKDYEYVKDTKGQSFVSKLNDKDAMYVSAIQELKEEIDLLKANLEQLKYNRR